MSSELQRGRCAKCDKFERYGFPFKVCNDCRRSFHVKCLLKQTLSGSVLLLCAECKKRRRSSKESDRDRTIRLSSSARESSAASAVSARKSITSAASTDALENSTVIRDAGLVIQPQASQIKSVFVYRDSMTQGVPEVSPMECNKSKTLIKIQ